MNQRPEFGWGQTPENEDYEDEATNQEDEQNYFLGGTVRHLRRADALF